MIRFVKLCVLLFFLITNKTKAQELKYYSCFIDRIDVDQWAKNGKRTFDSDGIIMNEGKYHPLGIIHYGMLNYYAFLERKDSAYYFNFLDQIKYFQDTSKLDFHFEAKGIGLPYDFNYHNLKAPWYSGMTQGYALSFLLRYRDLTNDESITPTIEKIAYLLIQPQEKGGTIGKTPEGYTFIEEYPNGKSKEVFNGFVNGLIGLKEYCDFFPKDTMAKRIHDESLNGVIKTMGEYDIVDWSNYNRSGGRCSDKYMRYEIFELKHLFELYRDSVFLDQMKLWSVYAHNRFNTEKQTVYKLKNFQTAESLLYNAEKLNYYSKINLDTNFYSNVETSINGEIQLIKATRKSVNYNIFLDSSLPINYLDLGFNSNRNCKKIRIYSPDKQLNISVKKPIENHLYMKLDEPVKTDKIEVEIKGYSEIQLSRIFLSELKPFKVPFYQFYKKSPQEITTGTYQFVIPDGLNAKDVTLFFRTGKDQKSILSTKWSTKNMVRGNHGEFNIDSNGFIQLMVVFAPTMPYSEIGDIIISKK